MHNVQQLQEPRSVALACYDTHWTAHREPKEVQMASCIAPARLANEFLSAYAKLKMLVITNQFSPNERMQVNSLAKRLAVGVTPIREALIRLSVEGLVTAHAKRGFFAKVLTVNELHQLYHLAFSLLRSVVQWDGERPGIEIAAADIRILSGTQNDRHTSLALAVEQLHEKIAMVKGNAQIAKVIRNYNCRTHAVRLVHVGQVENVESIVEYISSMTTLLEIDDREGIIRELRRHFDAKMTLAPKLIKEATAQACSADWENHHFRSTDFAQRHHWFPTGTG
jgi:DNA-binding GntR family transcriptional regulator